MNIQEAQSTIQLAIDAMVQDRLFAGDDYEDIQQIKTAWALIKEVIRMTT